MGKTLLSDEDIVKYLRDGWHFHKKNIGKYQYITTRRRQKTKSHGKYNDSDWNRILKIRKNLLWREVSPVNIIQEDEGGSELDIGAGTIMRMKKFEKVEKALLAKLKHYRAIRMSLDCIHMEEHTPAERYCTRWKFYTENHFEGAFDDYFDFFYETREHNTKKIVEENGDVYWITRAVTTFCMDCASYISK